MNYQPRWQDGKQTSPGTRESAFRYEAIKPVLQSISQPFSMIDLGAHSGYFSIRVAEDFDCWIMAVDKERFSIDSERIQTAQARIDEAYLLDLPRPDVVLALSVLHHLPDWQDSYRAMRRLAKQALIMEVPHPEERLKYVPNRHSLQPIYDRVVTSSIALLGTSPATRQPELTRELHLVPPLIVGRMFGGSGTHSKMQERYGSFFEAHLGYRPYPGSLNLKLDRPLDFGSPHSELIVGRKRDYQFWQARILGVEAPAHMMIPGKRGWPESVELLSPVRLRDQFTSVVPFEILPSYVR